MSFIKLERGSFGCLESRLLTFHDNQLLHDVRFSTYDQPNDFVGGHKVILAAISQKIFNEIARIERGQVRKIFQYKKGQKISRTSLKTLTTGILARGHLTS